MSNPFSHFKVDKAIDEAMVKVENLKVNLKAKLMISYQI